MPASPLRGALLKRCALALSILVLGTVIVAGSIYGYWVKAEHRLTVITPGHVYQSAAMPPEDLLRVTARLGVQTVFDFRGDSGEEGRLTEREQQALGHAGIHYVHIPSSIRPAPETVASFVQAMGKEVAAHRTVLLHCRDGEGRAVFFSAVYRMQFEGWTNQRAYEATNRLPPSLHFLAQVFPSLGRLSPQNAKTPLILNYRPSSAPVKPAPVL